MNEPKPFASLSSGLLARKGQAKPAMRPQGFGSFGTPAPGAGALDDLGWNDMGHDRPHVSVGLTPLDSEPVEADIVPLHADYELPEAEEPVVLQQFDELERSFSSDEGGQQGIDKLSPNGSEDDTQYEPARAEPVEALSYASPLAVKKAHAVAAPRPAPVPRAAPGSKARAAFTLRLDADRHLKLRLAAAVTHRSAQALVIDALDAFIAANPQLRELGH